MYLIYKGSIKMKKVVILFLLFISIQSCSVTDEGDKFSFENVAIESVIVPDHFDLGLEHEIVVNYFRPTSCHIYDGINFDKDLNVRIISVRNSVFEGPSCAPLDEVLVTQTFNFKATNNGSYIFKFWNGLDTNGQSVYLEYEIPVVD
jgi:hypothetical protein